ncbi:hypothetical protein H5410_028095 [Solanum commersonii]|uniref:Uncharacterized protein n=1 Tax=Solanum commersonii TaxID=4109 RepID=A0A9J5Z0Z4_SOLCO|nr:hypothetical protein H5410_028095 [Solanum commersonii]
MRFNRRKKYKEMLPTQKETLLLQKRTRDLESRRRLLQVPLMIREPYVMSTKVVTSEVHTSAITSPKGKSLFHPSCVDPDEPIVKVKARVMRPVVADPFRKGVKQGPKIASGQFKKNLRCIREGRDSSAALECGDDTIGSKSYFIQFKCQERCVNSTG